MRPVVILAGGEPVAAGVLSDLPDDAWVIAADSGLDQALALGLDVHLRVGDFDSASPEAMHAYRHVPEERWPADKDATDLEIAMQGAVLHGAERIVVVGGHGRRLDHHLGNASLLASPDFAGIDVEWLAGDARVHVVHVAVELHGSAGDVVSLIPAGGDAVQVNTEGLRWELADAILPFGTSRGISNELARPVARVRLGAGTLLVVLPGQVGTDP
ncbi:MAG: thiamine diphosphokinase [Acidimicrobiia bacterium]